MNSVAEGPPSYEDIVSEECVQAGVGEGGVEKTYDLPRHVKELNKKAYISRVKEINERLKYVGYFSSDSEVTYGHPVVCPEYLMKFESKLPCRVETGVPFVRYQKKMDGYLSKYKEARDVLTLKIKELTDMGEEKGDPENFTWVEESGEDDVCRRSIRYYYEKHQDATDLLIGFIERQRPVDGLKLFNEKNNLVEEKIDLLVKLRQLQIAEVSD
jgi:hypothetical protein